MRRYCPGGGWIGTPIDWQWSDHVSFAIPPSGTTEQSNVGSGVGVGLGLGV